MISKIALALAEIIGPLLQILLWPWRILLCDSRVVLILLLCIFTPAGGYLCSTYTGLALCLTPLPAPNLYVMVLFVLWSGVGALWVVGKVLNTIYVDPASILVVPHGELAMVVAAMTATIVTKEIMAFLFLKLIVQPKYAPSSQPTYLKQYLRGTVYDWPAIYTGFLITLRMIVVLGLIPVLALLLRLRLLIIAVPQGVPWQLGLFLLVCLMTIPPLVSTVGYIPPRAKSIPERIFRVMWYGPDGGTTGSGMEWATVSAIRLAISLAIMFVMHILEIRVGGIQPQHPLYDPIAAGL